MQYTLGQAAKATGKSKSVIQRAILKGRISAQKDEYEQWNIEASELHRVFPLAVPETGNKNDAEHLNTGKIRDLETELKVIKERLEEERGRRIFAEKQAEAWQAQAEQIQKLLPKPEPTLVQAATEAVEALKTEIEAEPTPAPVVEPQARKRGFWARLVG